MNKMKFEDFLKDKISYAITYFIGISLVMLIMDLSTFIKLSYFSIENCVYAYIVSIVIFIIFLIYEYSKVRSFYNRLGEILNCENIIDAIINVGEVRTAEENIFKNILTRLHKIYEKELYKYQDMQKQYLTFINQWVHQMKTPVSVINLILQEENFEEAKESFESIGEENEKITQGLNIMLYNARINEFNHDFNVEDIDLTVLARKVINDNKKSFIKSRIFPKVLGNETKVYTDKKWAYFVINQIIINAIKYTNASFKDAKSINISIEDRKDNVLLSIEDNGIGIPREDLGRVFDAFFTGKNGRKTSESTGMGLYLSKRICDELGHKLHVESKEGDGTNFFIVFNKEKNIFKI
ncbi:sensor histidine kinase [Clostridium sp. TW13]|uniref:Sensor histidine kinase n=1 Tax=Inconstantimicrobium mannanitabidum TaxID=1604901 RepID=A0ACB5RD45_9CLOT|nr:sensor histidine kinase [Clostridium sp. TW13]